jgi:hypothetical protein
MAAESLVRRVVGTFRDADDADRARDELADGRLSTERVDENLESDVEVGVASEELRHDDSAERPPDLTVAVEAEDDDEVARVAAVLEAHGAEVVVVEPPER